MSQADQLLTTLRSTSGVLFDLDGVLTPTASVHMLAWRTMFEELFRRRGIEPAYTDADYFMHLDGKRRYDGVDSVLRSRGIELPWGESDDHPDADTVSGIGNRKNAVFSQLLDLDPIEPYPGSVRVLRMLQQQGTPVAVVSSSKNARAVLASAGLAEDFRVIVDGLVAEQERLPSKPAPDMFLEGARRLGVAPSDTVAIEDAVSGVRSAAAAGCGLVIGIDRGTGEEPLRAAGAHAVVEDLAELF